VPLHEAFRLGRRALEGTDGVEVVGDVGSSNGWLWFAIDVTIDAESGFIPRRSRWYVRAEADYPIGRVRIYPSNSGGVVATFPHMERNDPTTHPWRAGHPCLDRPGRWLGGRELADQPSSAEERIRWHVARLREWLVAAATDALVGPSDPFELPKFPTTDDLAFGFDEDPERFGCWQPHLGQSGQVMLKYPHKKLLIACAFSLGEAELLPSRWGGRVEATEASEIGAWIAFKEVPVMAPWYVPGTWGELRQVAQRQKMDLDGHLQRVYRDIHARGVAKESHLLLGFPIPKTWGGEPARMHWQRIALPAPISVSPRKFHVRKGAAKTKGAWSLERYSLFRDEKVIQWRDSTCWSEDFLASRGALSPQLRSSKVALLGCGALGSPLAQCLVREGVNNILLCDGEDFEVPNLRRHVLTASSAEYEKSLALRVELADASLFAKVAYTQNFPVGLGTEEERFRDSDTVIDCTGNDDVAFRLAAFAWDGCERWFFSGSIGVDARRLFLFAHRGTGFPAESFLEAVRPYVVEERARLREHDPALMMVAGCWNPVFPARWDRILSLAGRMVDAIDATVSGVKAPGFDVIEL